MSKPTITEAEAEKLADARVWRILSMDRAYIHAENAEAQAAREEEIGRKVWIEIKLKYEIS